MKKVRLIPTLIAALLSTFLLPHGVTLAEGVQRVNSTNQINETSMPSVISKSQIFSSDAMIKSLNNTQGLVPLDTDLKIFPEGKKLNLTLDNIGIAEVLRIIGQEGNKNVIIDDSVKGTINADLKNVSLNDALKIILISKELEVRAEGNNIFIASRPAMAQKGLNRKYIKTFKLDNANAVEVAQILEASVFNKGYKINDAAATPASSSPSTSGTALQAMAVPQNTPQSAAQSSTPTQAVQAASNDGTTTGLSSIADKKVVKGKVEEIVPGTGFGNAKMLASEIQMQYTASKTKDIDVSNNDGGAIVIPDTRTNSIIVAGLKEDIDLAQNAITSLDRPLKQVAIEVSLIEINKDDTNNLGITTSTKGGKFNSGFNSPAQNTLGGLNATANQALLGFDTANNLSQQIAVQLNALIQKNKAKLLANPTIMALDNSESLIKITDQVVSKMDVVQTQTSTSYSVTLADVGIVLNILPQIGDNGFVTMRIRPSITTPLAEKSVGSFGAYVTPISTREIIIQDVRVKSGETLAIAGILKESDMEKIGSVPIVSDLPVFGNLFKSKEYNHTKNELVILITPKIVDESI